MSNTHIVESRRKLIRPKQTHNNKNKERHEMTETINSDGEIINDNKETHDEIIKAFEHHCSVINDTCWQYDELQSHYEVDNYESMLNSSRVITNSVHQNVGNTLKWMGEGKNNKQKDTTVEEIRRAVLDANARRAASPSNVHCHHCVSIMTDENAANYFIRLLDGVIANKSCMK